MILDGAPAYLGRDDFDVLYVSSINEIVSIDGVTAVEEVVPNIILCKAR